MCVTPQSPQFDQSMERMVELGLSIARGATDPHVFYEYAEVLWNVRDLEATAAALDRAIDGTPPLRGPELARAYALRAIANLQMAKLPQAEADVSRALAISPQGHPFALRGMALMFQGRHAEAVADADQSVRVDPTDWEAQGWRGMILLEAGRYADAIDAFTWVINSGECHRYASEIYLGRARAQLALGNPTEAVADCTEAIHLDYHEQSEWPFIVPGRFRDAHKVYLVRAEARLALGEHARALGDCCFAASIAPDDPDVYSLRQRVYYAIGNLPEAMRDMMRATHLPPRALLPGVVQREPERVLVGAPA
jgi:tetratricopeptide (TPR) repeat protein